MKEFQASQWTCVVGLVGLALLTALAVEVVRMLIRRARPGARGSKHRGGAGGALRKWVYLYLALLVPVSGIGLKLFLNYHETGRGRARVRGSLDVIRGELADLKRCLAEYRQTHGRYPTNDEGLAALHPALRSSEYHLSDAGVRSPWGLLYVYENRNGHSPDAFEHSPVNDDEQQRFSLRVDDGVYLYSVGGRMHAEWLASQESRDRLIALWGLGLCVAAFVLLVLVFLSGPVTACLLGMLAVAGPAAIALRPPVLWNCYAVSPMFYRRSPRMVARQRELLDKYHAAGVINDATYRKSLSAIAPKNLPKPRGAETWDALMDGAAQ